MDRSRKSITYECTIKAPNGQNVRIPQVGTELEATSTRPDDYSIFYFFGESQCIASKAFPKLYVGCTDRGLLATVEESLAIPFTMDHGGQDGEAASTMTGRIMATDGQYAGQYWYYLGGFQGSHIQMEASPSNSGASIYTLNILDTIID